MEKLIDCHAHLCMEGVDAGQIIKNMAKDDLLGIVSVGTSPSDIQSVLESAKQNDGVVAALAFHPEYADQITDSDFVLLEKLAAYPKVVAIGECGLDYHYRTDNKEAQKRIFKRQIELAIKLQKPLMLHIREAEQDAISILNNYKGKLKQLVVHCYSAVSEEVTQAFLDLGACFSFAGNYTYKKYWKEVVKLIPQDRIMVETDSPFLAPVPLRGSVNQPKNVHLVAEEMADVLQLPADKLKAQLVKNAKRVYGI